VFSTAFLLVVIVLGDDGGSQGGSGHAFLFCAGNGHVGTRFATALRAYTERGDGREKMTEPGFLLTADSSSLPLGA
jgi:hypothetical protein